MQLKQVFSHIHDLASKECTQLSTRQRSTRGKRNHPQRSSPWSKRHEWTHRNSPVSTRNLNLVAVSILKVICSAKSNYHSSYHAVTRGRFQALRSFVILSIFVRQNQGNLSLCSKQKKKIAGMGIIQLHLACISRDICVI